MERVLLSKRGLPTAASGDKFLHSAYDPEREADRFARNHALSAGDLVLFLGSCLGYPERRLAELNPGLKVLRVAFSDFFRPARGEAPDQTWFPGSGEAFSSFLARHIDEASFKRLKILEWEAAKQAYPEVAESLARELAQFCRELNGSLVTTRVFGKLWLRNCVRNVLYLEARTKLLKVTGPVFIAASGPSLAEAEGFLKANRSRLSLWALPSSLDYLLSRGLVPDLAILTDPGHYAAHHFRSARRAGTLTPRPVLLMAPTAVSDLPRETFRVGFLDQESWPEREFLPSNQDREKLPANGTVAGSAIELALRKTHDAVIVAGLDLSCRDLAEHVTPHAFESLTEAATGKFRGLEAERFRRLAEGYPERLGAGFRTSRSLATYAGWFAARKALWKGRVFRFRPSPVDLGMETWDVEAFRLPSDRAAADWAELPLPQFRERKTGIERALGDVKTKLETLGGKGPEAFFAGLALDRGLADFYLLADTEGFMNRSAEKPAEAALDFLSTLQGDLNRL